MQDVNHQLLDAQALSKLKWRCRRGLLENDLFIERFFRNFEHTLTVGQADALGQLMDLSDNDLLDILLERKPLDTVVTVDAQLACKDMQEVLRMLKTKPLTH